MALLTGKAIPRTGVIDDETLGTAIADAEALIHAALQQRYTLPFQNPPRLLQRIALDLVHERLHDGVYNALKIDTPKNRAHPPQKRRACLGNRVD